MLSIFQIALDTSYWTWLNHLAIWGSLIFYFALQYFYNFVLQGAYVGSLSTVRYCNYEFCCSSSSRYTNNNGN